MIWIASAWKKLRLSFRKILRRQADREDQMDEFFKWLDGKELIPRIREIKENAVNDFNLRIMKPLKNTQMDEQEKKLINAVDTAMGKGYK